MINFSDIANPPIPVFRPICGVCEGRGVTPATLKNSLQSCKQCNGTGKEGNTPIAADEQIPEGAE